MYNPLMFIFVLLCKVGFWASSERNAARRKAETGRPPAPPSGVSVNTRPTGGQNVSRRCKICPRCGTQTHLADTFCSRCGHKYRTKFEV